MEQAADIKDLSVETVGFRFIFFAASAEVYLAHWIGAG